MQPSQNILKKIISACKDTSSLAKTHALIITCGLFDKFYVQLISSYAQICTIECARKVFDKLPRRKIDAYNAIIVAYSRKCHDNEVVSLYHQMGLDGVKPDSSTFTITIKACASLSDLETGEEVRLCAYELGYEKDLFFGSSLLNFYTKCGKMDEAMSVFNEMRKRDLVSWTTMITGLAKCGRALEAIGVYRMMREENMEGDKIVMLGLIQASCNIEDQKIGFSIHGYMIRKNLAMDVVVQTSLVDMYSKFGNLGLAYRVFETIRNKTVVSFSALISGYAQNGFSMDALSLLRDMQIFGFNPDLASLVSSLLGCSYIGFLKLGKSIHGYVVRRFDLDGIICTSLIDMYSKCGCLYNARVLFDRINDKDLVCWNTMIASYGIHGQGMEALTLFLRMREENVEPDHATFSSILSASSHSGLVQEGQCWFDIMIKEYQIPPSEKHYACLVDLLARAGKVEEAFSLVNNMEIEPGITILAALLSGCQIHRKFLIGEVVAKKIIKLEPDEPGIYTLVSNFFATAKMWDDVAKVRRAMKGIETKKVPGCSSVEVNKKVYSFVMEDKSHSHYENIIGSLKMLEYEMRDMGCLGSIEMLHNGFE